MNPSKSRLAENKAHTLPDLTSTIPANLPLQTTRFVGRYEEMMSLRLLLLREDIRLVTITGFGGAGKTTLSLRIASTLLEQFPSGVFFVSLEPLTDPAQILSAILQALKLREEQNTTLQQTLDDFLSQRAILLVLDNFEHLIEGASLVNELLEKHEYLKILTTSREPLRLRREQVFPLEAMPIQDAVELFAQRARTLKPSFSLNDEEATAVSHICEKLDGLPLAIELAAQRITLFPPRTLLARLQSSDLNLSATSEPATNVLSFLTSKTRDLPARHQTLQKTIAWSYGLLNADEQRVFRAASLFLGGFQLEALQTVTDMEEALLLDAVSSLVDKNLLRVNPSLAGESRFTMLITIREYAWTQALKLEDMTALKKRYIGYYLVLARDAEQGFRGNDQVQWLDRLDTDIANLQTALGFALENGYESPFWQSGYQMLIHLQRYWLLRAHYTAGLSWLEKAKTILDRQIQNSITDISTELIYQKSKVYGLLGYVYWIMGRYATAKELHGISLAAARTLNDKKLLWEILNNNAVNLEYMGEFEAARTYYEQALQIIKTLGDRWQEMRLLINLGNSCVGKEEYEIGRAYLADALHLTIELKDEYYQAACLQGIGYLELRLRRYKEAEENFLESLRLFERMDVPFIYSWALVSLARVLSETKKHRETAQVVLKCVEMLATQKDQNLYRTMFDALIAFCISLNKNEMAARFIGFIEQNYAGEGEVILPADKVIFEEMTRRVKEAISQEEYGLQIEIGRRYTALMLFQITTKICNDVLRDRKLQPDLRDFLTDREIDVLRLIAHGKSNTEISRELVVVGKTVEKHVANIFRKTGTKNRTEAAVWLAKFDSGDNFQEN